MLYGRDESVNILGSIQKTMFRCSEWSATNTSLWTEMVVYPCGAPFQCPAYGRCPAFLMPRVWNIFISLPNRAATCLAAHWEALATALFPSFQQHNISTQSVRHSLPLSTSWAYYYTKACKVLFSNCCLELLTCRWSVPSFCKNKTILVKFVGSKLRGGGVSVKLTNHCYSALHRGSSHGEGNDCAMKCLSTG